MNRRNAAILTLCVLGVAVPVTVFSADSGEVSSGEPQSQETSDAGRKTDDPRTVVAKWMDLVLADNVRESWELTTTLSEPGWLAPARQAEWEESRAEVGFN